MRAHCQRTLSAKRKAGESRAAVSQRVAAYLPALAWPFLALSLRE